MILTKKEYILHLACGVGLMLVPAIHERICADTSRTAVVADASAEADRPAEHSRRSEKSRKPLALAALVPDVVVPRWPGHVPLEALRRVEHLPAAGWLPPEPELIPAGSNQAHRAVFADFRLSRLLKSAALSFNPSLDGADAVNIRHLFSSSITRTGPPIV